MLLRQYMAWGIASNPLSRSKPKKTQLGMTKISPLQALSIKLLLSYVGAMVTVLGLSAVVVYQFFAYSLAQKLDLHLLMIAEAARHNFSAIESNPAAARNKQFATIDQDGDLDLPWQDLDKATDTVEWFDASGQRISVAGYSMLPRPFIYRSQPMQQGNIRSLIIPAGTAQVPEGYVRVSTDTSEMTEDLNRLLLGLGIGGAVAVTLVGASGWWLARRSLQPIERSIEKLQQFTADASHELRSPITAIKTAIEVMQSHPERVHPADVKKLAIIAQATQYMTYLMDDLLLLVRHDNEAAQRVDLTLIPLHDLLEELVEGVRSKAASAGLTLHMEPLCKSWVLGNAVQLSRVFLNLLDNAIKYTPSGGTIHVSLRQQDETVLASVIDTGIGIELEQLPRIFDRFWRADQSRSRKAGGTGLGLAIAQTIVEVHRGKIVVNSKLGTGSCFQVELPSRDPEVRYA
jgi:signal transduction histidine kinase